MRIKNPARQAGFFMAGENGKAGSSRLLVDQDSNNYE